jgi:signal transduction histidine kinase
MAASLAPTGCPRAMSRPVAETTGIRFVKNRIFEGIHFDVLHEIISNIETRTFEKDEIIFREGDRGDVLYLVDEGSVKISKLGRGGGQETLGFIAAGNFFGEMALLDGEPRSAMAAATGPTVLGVVDEPAFQRILEHAPSRLHLNFLRSVTQRLRQIDSHFITEVMRTERLSMLGAMASMILHDLNNPISTVRCCCEVIDRESSDPQLVEATALLNSAVDGMLAMTQELLDFARGSMSLNKKRLTLANVLHELRQQSQPLLAKNNVQLVVKLDYTGQIDLDAARVLRMLGNLVKNACEAMPYGGVLTITTELVGVDLLIRIADTGVGIPPELLPRLFEPFVTHGKPNGTGLGMPIAKSVVEAHGGTISVSSVVGSGTEIRIKVPAPAPGV